MHIRKMTLEDVKAVYMISVRCFSEPWSLDAILKEVDNPLACYLVAEQGDTIVGYAGRWHVLD